MKFLPYAGTVKLSGSKSMLQRYLFMASLYNCQTILKPGSVCDDVTEMAEAVRACGVSVKPGKKALKVDSLGLNLHSETTVRFNASATALRFWLARSLFVKAKSVILISEQLAKRPLQPFLDDLRSWGCKIKTTEGNGSEYKLRIEITPPLEVPEEVEIDADVSSQFISGLMMAGTLTDECFTVRFKQTPVSFMYLLLTEFLMRGLNINVYLDQYVAFMEKGKYLCFPKTALIEPEASGAAFFMVLGNFTKSGIEVINPTRFNLQPDLDIIPILLNMGADIKFGDWPFSPAKKLHGIERDMQDNPDLVPLLAVLALFADSPTTLKRISRLQYKESDRIKGILNAFEKIGAGYLYGNGSLQIFPYKKRPPKCVLDTQNDHRLVIAFTLLKLHFPQLELSETESVKKSCPEFFSILASLKQKA